MRKNLVAATLALVLLGPVGLSKCNTPQRDDRPSCVKVKRDNGGVQPKDVPCKS